MIVITNEFYGYFAPQGAVTPQGINHNQGYENNGRPEHDIEC